jgi:hypothetical protein
VLSGGGKRLSAGTVPVGNYEVIVTFPGRDARSFGTVTVEADDTVRIACDTAFANCTIQ